MAEIGAEEAILAAIPRYSPDKPVGKVYKQFQEDSIYNPQTHRT